MTETTTDRFAALHPSPEFEEFRDLLLSSEKQEIDSLEVRLEDIRKPDAIGERLPDAIRHSVKTDREKMAGALSPILGPAIRLYVNEMFKSLVDQMNVSIQNATSIERFRWRLEAKSAGVPFSEYVILKSINFSMKDVLLIDPQSGLLQQHVWKGETSSLQSDPDLVSGMLAAIRSFAKDTLAYNPQISTGYSEEPELERFSFGNYEIFVHTGPRSILAVIGSGVPPKEFRDLLLEVSENIQIQQTLDSSADLKIPEQMERLLIEQRPSEGKTKTWPAWLVAGTAIAGLVGWGVFSTQRESTWQRGIAAVNATRGIEVLSHQKSGGWKGERTIRILKDPMAPAPETILNAEMGELARKARLEISPYLSMESEFADARSAIGAENQAEFKKDFETQEAAHRMELSSALYSRLTEEKRDLELKLNAVTEILEGPLGVVPGKLTPALFENRFATTGANISKTNGVWNVSGTVLESDFERIQRETADLIFDGGSVDFSNLKIRASIMKRPEFEIRSDAIEAVEINFPSGESTLTNQVEIGLETVIGKMKLLDQWCLDSGKQLPFYEIHAAPIVGDNEEENHKVRERRLEKFSAAAVSERIAGGRLIMIHDSGKNSERIGLYVRAFERAPATHNPAPHSP